MQHFPNTTKRIVTEEIERKHITLVSVLSDKIMSDPDLSTLCDEVAKIHSGTTEWTSQEWEDNENTEQYKRYWDHYVLHQSLVVSKVLTYILGG